MKITVNALATSHGVEYQVAAGLMNYLRAKGIAVEVGIDKIPGTKGKGKTIYEVPEWYVINLAPVSQAA